MWDIVGTIATAIIFSGACWMTRDILMLRAAFKLHVEDDINADIHRAANIAGADGCFDFSCDFG